MDQNSSPNYKELLALETKRRKKAEEEQKQAEEQRRLAEEQRRSAEDRNTQFTRKTSLLEYLRLCHNLLSRPLRVRTPSRSTKGKIPAPQGKFCPARLLPWKDCATVQQEIYDSVCNYLHATSETPREIFSTVARVEGLAESLGGPLSSERDLESYERFAVENHVRDIILKLSEVPEARRRFRIGDGVWFESHSNTLEDDAEETTAPLDVEGRSSTQYRPRPDQFCIHRVDGKHSLLMTVEYKPPHKLTVENLRVGLRPQTDFWNDVVRRKEIPTEEAEKLKYNAEQIVGSVLTQEYHAMIWEGLEVSYVTIGLALVLLRVPREDPTTLLYFLCEPNLEINEDDYQSYREPRTAIARVLCLALMSSLTPVRDHAWRNGAMAQLKTWATSFALVRSQIPDEELQQAPPGSEYTGSPHTSSEGTNSEWLPSSPLPSPTPQGPAQPRSTCAPPQTTYHLSESSDDEESGQTSSGMMRKRGHSQVTSSSPPQSSKQGGSHHGQGSRNRQQTQDFCTQQCILGLQLNGPLDVNCPNASLHRRDGNDTRHPVTAKDFVHQLNKQLNEDIDHNCTPFGDCGSFGAPFKVVCARYGYTLLGKGTTTHLWKDVKREAVAYQILRKAQGSAVPVFLGTIDLAMSYFLHGAGAIRHMLLMAWGGCCISDLEPSIETQNEAQRSKNEILSLGVIHKDLCDKNLLWNAELRRVLVIDFHDVALQHGPKTNLAGSKRRSHGNLVQQRKRLRTAFV